MLLPCTASTCTIGQVRLLVYNIKDYWTGINEYLTKFSYRNTATEDLWESLSAASGKPVVMVMSNGVISWDSQY